MKKISFLIGGACFSLSLNAHAAVIECPNVDLVKTELIRTVAELKSTLGQRLQLPAQQSHELLLLSQTQAQGQGRSNFRLTLHTTPNLCQYKVNDIVVYTISREIR